VVSIGKAPEITQTKTEQKPAASRVFYARPTTALIAAKIWDYPEKNFPHLQATMSNDYDNCRPRLAL
jgi:hypothetical protein